MESTTLKLKHWSAAALLTACAGCRGAGENAAPAPPAPGDDPLAIVETLPYVVSGPVETGTVELVGTTYHDRAKACPGYNLYTLYSHPVAYLADLQGRVVHRWTSEVCQPESDVAKRLDFLRGWQGVHMLADGSLLAIVSRGCLLKLDRDSRLVWQQALPAHHDVTTGPDGRIYTLTDEFRHVGPERRLILDDVIQVLDPRGEPRLRLSLHDLLARDPVLGPALRELVARRHAGFAVQPIATELAGQAGWTRPAIAAVTALLAGATGSPELGYRELFTLARALPRSPVDVFHSNAVLPLEAHPDGLWQAGDVLVSVNHLSLLAVIDPLRRRIRWSLRGLTDTQHQPSLLPGGNLLVFDNGRGRGRSRAIEIDPRRREVVWSYEGGAQPFYSASESGVQKLPNGNVLIAITGEGRMIEVTVGGEIVWEHWAALSELSTAQGPRLERFKVYRMTRLPAELVDPLLARPGGS